MYVEHEQEYMSEPIDEMSESSYIRINKKFLENLKEINQIQDLSRYRQDSEFYSENQSQSSGQNMAQPDQSFEGNVQTYQNSPIVSNLYKQNLHKISNESDEDDNLMNLSPSSKRKEEKFGKHLKNKPNYIYSPLSKVAPSNKEQKMSKLSSLTKKQTQKAIQNTFQYYLIHKNQQQKQKRGHVSNLNIYSDSPDLIQTCKTRNPCFNHVNKLSNSKQNHSKPQFSRINYKQLLQNEIHKNKQFQKHIYKLQAKLSTLNLELVQEVKNNKKLQKELNSSEKVRRQNKLKMAQLDRKLEELKGMCRTKNCQKNQEVQQIRKQNKTLRDENENYRLFAQTLGQSIFVLKGKKPKKLQDIWQQWKEIFQSVSKKKWTSYQLRSPKSKLNSIISK